MSLPLLLLAAVAYAVGGLFMKQSDGLSRLSPTLAFQALFLAGATLQALGMKTSEMGVSYILVLGAEAVAATLLSVAVLREGYSLSRAAATLVIVAGMVWLRRA